MYPQRVPRFSSGQLQIPIEDDGETRSKAKKPIQPQPENPGLATIRAHSQPKDTLGIPSSQAQAAVSVRTSRGASEQAAGLSGPSAGASVPPQEPVEPNDPTDERAEIDADGKENGAEHVVEQETVQVKVTLVATTPSLPAEDDAAKPKSDAKRINP